MRNGSGELWGLGAGTAERWEENGELGCLQTQRGRCLKEKSVMPNAASEA